jgi:hypothetical protein
MAEEPADGEGEGIAEADGRGATETGAALVSTSPGAAAAWRPPPSAIARAMPMPVRARTATRPATPDRKLISSKRAFITRLSLAAQPVPSLTTKHDTWVLVVVVGLRGPKPTFPVRRAADGLIFLPDCPFCRSGAAGSPPYPATLRNRR